jgi:hypothetical protein
MRELTIRAGLRPIRSLKIPESKAPDELTKDNLKEKRINMK